VTDAEKINRACFRLLTMPDMAPLLAWWELQLSNSPVPAGPVDPYRLAMAQGDRERLASIKTRAEAHRLAHDGEKGTTT
jgi:hypothetical protein